MKRRQGLMEGIADRANLIRAFLKAAKGKSRQPEVVQFRERLEEEIAELRDGLLAGDYPVGRYVTFRIRDPKPRTICAAVFPERVLHHAILNVCEGDFERRLTAHTYACRKGKGTRGAVRAAADHARVRPWFLKMDIRKYFDSIDHEILRGQVRRIWKDPGLLGLLDRIIGAYESAPGKGVPIGSLTSQFFANGYLAGFDRFVTEELRCRCYVRYMDDGALWGWDREELKCWREGTVRFLRETLCLEVKQEPFVNRTRLGMDWLGYRVFPGRVDLNRRSRVRFERKLRRYVEALAEGWMSEGEYQARVTALVAFTEESDGAGAWRRSVLRKMRAGAWGENRVLRGGSWNNGAENCASGYRNGNHPANRNQNNGFRAVLPPSPDGDCGSGLAGPAPVRTLADGRGEGGGGGAGCE